MRGLRAVLVAIAGVVAFVWIVFTLTGWGTGGQTKRPDPSAETARGEFFLAFLNLGEVQLPFILMLPPSGTSGTGTIVNGAEEIDVPVERTERAVRIPFPHYDSELRFEMGAKGQLRGAWHKTRPGGNVAIVPLSGHRIPDPLPERRFPAPPAGVSAGAGLDAADFAHVWRIEFGRSGLAKGVFHQSGSGVLSGTIITPTGDYRYLAGQVFGRVLALSTFDGAHAFMVVAEQPPDGQTMRGRFYSGAHWKEPFHAVRADRVALPDPMKATAFVAGRFDHPRLRSAPYAGQPTVVTLLGTWCPNCHDEAPILASLEARYRARGLRFLGLAFELTAETERSARQIAAFKARHGLSWEIVHAGTSDKKAAAAALGVEQVVAYPTTLFLRPDRTILAVHTGFSGPATGHAHRELVERFDALAEQLTGPSTAQTPEPSGP